MLHQVFDAITVDTHELEPRSADFLGMSPSHSWETHGSNDTNVENKKFVEVSTLLRYCIYIKKNLCNPTHIPLCFVFPLSFKTNERVPNLEREPSKSKGERVVVALDRPARVPEHKNAISGSICWFFVTDTFKFHCLAF